MIIKKFSISFVTFLMARMGQFLNVTSFSRPRCKRVYHLDAKGIRSDRQTFFIKVLINKPCLERSSLKSGIESEFSSEGNGCDSVRTFCLFSVPLFLAGSTRGSSKAVQNQLNEHRLGSTSPCWHDSRRCVEMAGDHQMHALEIL